MVGASHGRARYRRSPRRRNSEGTLAPWPRTSRSSSIRATLGDLPARPMDEVRRMRAECQEVETGLSLLRRLVQGRLDIVGLELARRAEGGDPADLPDLIARLPQVLSDRTHAPGRRAPPADDGAGRAARRAGGRARRDHRRRRHDRSPVGVRRQPPRDGRPARRRSSRRSRGTARTSSSASMPCRPRSPGATRPARPPSTRSSSRRSRSTNACSRRSRSLARREGGPRASLARPR